MNAKLLLEVVGRLKPVGFEGQYLIQGVVGCVGASALGINLD